MTPSWRIIFFHFISGLYFWIFPAELFSHIRVSCCRVVRTTASLEREHACCIYSRYALLPRHNNDCVVLFTDLWLCRLWMRRTCWWWLHDGTVVFISVPIASSTSTTWLESCLKLTASRKNETSVVAADIPRRKNADVSMCKRWWLWGGSKDDQYSYWQSGGREEGNRW